MNRPVESIRLGSWHQAFVYGGTALLVLSGIVWLVLHYFFIQAGEFGDVTHPLEPWMLKLHGAAAMLGLVVYGSLLPVHVRRAWSIRRNLFLGIAVLVVMLLLTLTGYLLYYAAGEDTRPVISAVHWIVGLGVPLLLAWHVLSGRRRTQAALATRGLRAEAAR